MFHQHTFFRVGIAFFAVYVAGQNLYSQFVLTGYMSEEFHLSTFNSLYKHTSFCVLFSISSHTKLVLWAVYEMRSILRHMGTSLHRNGNFFSKLNSGAAQFGAPLKVHNNQN